MTCEVEISSLNCNTQRQLCLSTPSEREWKNTFNLMNYRTRLAVCKAFVLCAVKMRMFAPDDLQYI